MKRGNALRLSWGYGTEADGCAGVPQLHLMERQSDAHRDKAMPTEIR